MITDIHTHRETSPHTSIIDCGWQDGNRLETFPYVSASLHPWFLTADNSLRQLEWLARVAGRSNVLAIGETGLDKRCGVSLDLQIEVFRHVVRIAEDNRRPLILHVVRATDELLRLKKESGSSVPWIIHGFRGKPQQADAFLRQGFYLSYGEKYHPDSLAATPDNRLLIETDESHVLVGTLYEQAASRRNMSAASLLEIVQANCNRLFFTR